jgi:hypothetical protein
MRYRKKSLMVSRKVADEVILVPIRQKVGDLQSIYSLNEVGGRIWELLDSERTLAEMASIIAAEYEVSQSQAEGDLAEFIASLESIEAIAAS